MNWKHNAFDDLGYYKIQDFIAEHCLSDLAKERAHSLLPLQSLDTIRQRSHAVTEFTEILEHDDPFPLYGVTDVDEPLRHSKIENALLNTEALLHIAKLLEISRSCHRYFQTRGDQYQVLKKISQDISPHKSIEKDIREKINDYGEVEDSASSKLRQLRKDIMRQEASIREQMDRLTQQYADAGMLQEGHSTIRGGRLVIPVKSGYKSRVKGIVHDQSSSGQTFFIEPMAIVEGNNRLKELQMAEKEEVERILRALTAQVGEVAGEIRMNQDRTVHLDLLHAMAKYSREIEAFAPIVTEEHRFELKDAKNPVLMKSKSVVPNSVVFGETDAIILITGPNAGGKTVTLKTVGLLVLMAMTGLHIPAQEGSIVPLTDAIFVDIGDRQSLENDLSTFSSHIQRISHILENATDRSLVLLDELGTGTDPTEGAALARAILEALLEKKTLAVATTHHGALKAFAHNTEGILNAAMQFNQEDLSPTYSLKLGRPGSSYALEIAGRVGLPESVIHTARNYLDRSKEALEDLIVKLERQSEQLEKEQQDVSSQRLKYENLRQEYDAKVRRIRQEVKKAKRKAAEDAQKIIDESSRKVEEAIRKIKEEQASTESIKDAKSTLKDQKAELEQTSEDLRDEPDENQRPVDLEELHDGDRVYVSQFEKTGTISGEPKSKNRVMVDVEGMKMEVPVDILRWPENGKHEKEQKSQNGSGSKTRVHLSEQGSQSNKIDLRGQRVDEALASMEQFYNRALINGFKRLEIIHGKGTGALQKAVGEFLDQQKHITSHRYGELEEGGSGVTIAELE